MRVGDRVDRYVIDTLLGEGGMGAVYRAHDEKLHRTVALKVLRVGDVAGTDPSAATELAARMLREARAAAALDHPNVLSVFDIGEHDGSPYIAMEFVAGKTLRALLSEPPAPLRERVRWLADAARALAAAHKAGLVHRDVKPDNVMVRTDGVVKVLDFGIARRATGSVDPTAGTEPGVLGTLTGDGVVVGTPLYMAPEQLWGIEIDARTDQFAWGVTAYEVIAGRSPWAGRDLMSIGAAIVSTEPPSMPSDAECPPEIAAVVLRAMRKTPGERFATMDDAIDALEKALVAPQTTAPAQYPRPSTTESPPPADPARRRWTLAVAAVALAAVGALSVWARPTRNAPGSPSPPARPTAITDLPPPASSNAEALREYGAGLQALRDASWGNARRHFDAARTLDPNMAAAHLRTAVMQRFSDRWVESDVRERYAKAVSLRSTLSERDLGFLNALEPVFAREPQDLGEASRRMRALAERFPGDAELWVMTGYLGTSIFSNEEHRAITERAVEIDPAYADALQGLARLAGQTGRTDDGRRALDRCFAAAPSSADCFVERARIENLDGRCDAVVAAHRNVVSLAPGNMAAVERLAEGMYAAGRPRPSVLEVLEKGWRSVPDADIRESVRLFDEARLAILEGRFEDARSELQRSLAAIDARAEAMQHAGPAWLLVELEVEIGKPSDAARVARDYLARRDAWAAPDRASRDPAPRMLRVARRAGAISESDLETELARWRKEWEPRDGPANVWAELNASIETPEEAHAATLDLGTTKLPEIWYESPLAGASPGRVALLDGRAALALPLLERAARSCEALGEPIRHTRALLFYAQALEATGAPDKACAPYASVLARWGRAPESLTAGVARERQRALRCEP